jgi:hypothetical protein
VDVAAGLRRRGRGRQQQHVVVAVHQRVDLRADVALRSGELAQRVAPAAQPLELRHAEPALRRLLGPAAARLVLPGPGRAPAHPRPLRRDNRHACVHRRRRGWRHQLRSARGEAFDGVGGGVRGPAQVGRGRHGRGGVESDRLVVLVLAAPAVARRSLCPGRGAAFIAWWEDRNNKASERDRRFRLQVGPSSSISGMRVLGFNRSRPFVLRLSSLTEKCISECAHISRIHILKQRNTSEATKGWTPESPCSCSSFDLEPRDTHIALITMPPARRSRSRDGFRPATAPVRFY